MTLFMEEFDLAELVREVVSHCDPSMPVLRSV